MKIAVVGATGLVGGVMLKVLEERGFANEEIIAAASPKSIGKRIQFADRQLNVVSVDDAIAMKPDFAIFSAGAAASRQYAPLFAAAGTIVIDNSSAWRKDDDKPLVVPEVNFSAITSESRIIANPNCSTIQMVLAVSQLHKRYRIKRLVISTYQSITGTGIKAVRQLREEEAWHAEQVIKQGENAPSQVDAMGVHSQAYPYQIFRNLFPHGGDFQEDGYTTEEQKLVNETHKILSDNSIAITATVARVPVVGGHSESVNVEFHEEFEIEEVHKIIAETPGVILYDDPSKLQYPMPIMSEGRDEVFVGRVRRDLSQPRTLNLWIVADNLRKGAATNAIQIMQKMIKG
ncbi:MAG: aspartate-semialdehyde dehydrogenase [Bacteroidales bacterium]|nr:aspartate-semialdehyde dehydrogenase [Bacteroidales bacterium]